ncbi:hypothetical protein TUZN_1075 [Thermoproteus uzoniensis 768-20]|uniref:Uncharacterized protein n=1 Tax=Thermoproteus uzoniensis (strain 768-20) TaxID=999630 RepID=F2L073_THEU7|nr:hypothetical protein [Thermoproteus uzoniensis]AEA12555.1 hypothetical protein TUZN_1075 [Thermoproteus uzoniensis 768-20]
MTPLRAVSLAIAVALFISGLAIGIYTAAVGRFAADYVASFWTLAAMAYSYAYFAKWYERWLSESRKQ